MEITIVENSTVITKEDIENQIMKNNRIFTRMNVAAALVEIFDNNTYTMDRYKVITGGHHVAVMNTLEDKRILMVTCDHPDFN